MKWGQHRRTVLAAKKARQESIARDKERSRNGEKVTVRQAVNNANKASNSAVKVQKELSKIDRKLSKESSMPHRMNDPRFANRRKVIQEYNKDRLANSDLSQKWDKAFKAGKGTKEWEDYEKASNAQSMKFAKKYTDAFLKDVGMERVSDQARQYAQDNLYKTVKED
jgi:hypothetical protein